MVTQRLFYLLDELEELVRFLESLENLVDLEHHEYVFVDDALLHDVPPVLVDRGEAPTLLRHLSHDIRGAEDGLQVEPGGLHLEPLVQHVLQHHQARLPLPANKYIVAYLHCRIRIYRSRFGFGLHKKWIHCTIQDFSASWSQSQI